MGKYLQYMTIKWYYLPNELIMNSKPNTPNSLNTGTKLIKLLILPPEARGK